MSYNNRWAYEMFGKNCFFVEGGSNDGKNDSACYELENKYNWKGISIEANPRKFIELKNNRNCICISNPLTDKTGKICDFIVTKNHWLSGIKDKTLNDSFRLELFKDGYDIKQNYKLIGISLYDVLHL